MDQEIVNMSPSTVTIVDNTIHSTTKIKSPRNGKIFYKQNHSQLSYIMQIIIERDAISNESKLCYSGRGCHKIPETLVKLYGNKVNSLDMSYNDLTTIKGLEGFVHLKELILDNNQLNDNLIIPYLPDVCTLSLNKNNINDIEIFINQVKNNLPSLTYLSLLGNKACPNKLSDFDNEEEDYQRYRYFVLYHLPKLKFLDSTKVTMYEMKEAKNRGQLMKIVRPKETSLLKYIDTTKRNITTTTSVKSYTPLPRTIRNPDDHRGAYGKCKYKYTGKHSEGNRFISNNDL